MNVESPWFSRLGDRLGVHEGRNLIMGLDVTYKSHHTRRPKVNVTRNGLGYSAYLGSVKGGLSTSSVKFQVRTNGGRPIGRFVPRLTGYHPGAH